MLTDLTEPKPAPRRIAASVFIWILAFLLLANILLYVFKPLRWLNHLGLTSAKQHYMVIKLADLLDSPERADVLLMGDSLWLVPTMRTDDFANNRQGRYDKAYYRNVIASWTHADFLERSFNKLSQKPVSFRNAAIAAGMPSDQFLILKKWIYAKKQPRLILLSLAPRNIVDDKSIDVEKSPTYNLLNQLNTLPELLQNPQSTWQLPQQLANKLIPAIADRIDYQNVFVGLLSRATSRPATLYAAVGGAHASNSSDSPALVDSAKHVYVQPPNTLEDLDTYKSYYARFDPFQNRQIDYLRKTVALARNSAIPMVIVSMPITEQNRRSAPETLLKTFDSLLEEFRRGGAIVLEPQKGDEYSLRDFEDSVHLSLSGGRKLHTYVANQLRSIMAEGAPDSMARESAKDDARAEYGVKPNTRKIGSNSQQY